ncbi:Inositol 2-dehydrogenase/D-chiro-inositol 3-dehydrogenase [Pseudomonas fluorescens]|nr:Inositol 2-dehydrogenase/D-chiro-inositol 3-dehydrogenase [Pseudomonas fluorescens]
MIIRAVVIGVGRSGSRFLRAAQYIDPAIGKIEIVGVSDIDSEKLNALLGTGIRLEQDFKKILSDTPSDLIVIAVTDGAHYEILKYIKENSIGFKKIICEKPIVTKDEHCQFVRSAFDDDQIYVSFVERYSLAVSKLKKYIDVNNRNVDSATFVWSKYRVKDSRPTVGVISEITHPVDLACYLGAIREDNNFQIHFSCTRESDFVRGGGLRPETIMACAEFEGGMLLSGTSSYVQSERNRTMEFLLTNEFSKVVEVAVLRLDSPKWDDDHLSIFRVGDNSPCLETSYSTSSIKFGSRRYIEKICLFLEDVISDIDGEGSKALPTKSQALLVQNIVNQFEKGVVIRRRVFSEGNHASNGGEIHHLYELANLIKYGVSTEMTDDWGDQY